MRLGCFIQARMGSKRLPGKVCGPLCGKPLLVYVFERLERVAGLDFYAVATSTGPEDDAVRGLCAAYGVPCHSGPSADVALRFLEAQRAFPCDAFIRCCADSPLLDPALLSHGAALFRQTRPDIVCNVHPRTFPPGQSVEIVRAGTFLAAYPKMRGDELEHATLHFYRNASAYGIVNFESGDAAPGPGLCVDDLKDRRRLEGIIRRMTRPHTEYGWRELLALGGLLDEDGPEDGEGGAC